MESTKLALTKWFLAMYLMTQSKNAIATLELKRQLGVCCKTAWMLKHKLQEVMLQREAPRQHHRLLLFLTDCLPGFAAVSEVVVSHESHVTGAGKKAAQHPKFRFFG